MFTYKKRTPNNPALFDIVRDEQLLLHDEIYDILKIGRNSNFNEIIQVIIEEDDNDNVYYFSMIVRDETMFSFYGLFYPLLDCMKDANMICIQEYKIVDDKLVLQNVDLIDFEDIPKTYLPKEDATCKLIPALNEK